MIDDGKVKKLIINGLTTDDAAKYTVEADEASSSAELKVYSRKVTLVEGLQNQTVDLKSTATFTLVLSHKDVKVKWSKDGEDIRRNKNIDIIAEDNVYKLVMRRCEEAEKGTITASTTEGSINSSAKLQVAELTFAFTKELESVCVEEGDDAILECHVNKESANVTWEYNGKVIDVTEENSKFEVVSDGYNRQLIIKDTEEVDASLISCCFVEEIVLPEPVKGAEATVDSDGQPVEQNVSPMPEVDASGNMLARPSSVASREKSLSPQIRHGFNKEGSPVKIIEHKSTANLEVTNAVNIVKGLSDVEATPGAEVTLEVIVSNKTKGKWFQGDKELEVSEQTIIESDNKKHTLILKDLDMDDNNKIVFRTHKGKTTECNLIINDNIPEFVRELRDVSEDEKATVELLAELSLATKVEWFKDGQKLTDNAHTRIMTSGKRVILEIRNVSMDDAGKYEVKTKEGRSSSCEVSVSERNLKFITFLKDVTVDVGEQVEFNVELSHEVDSVEWYRNDEPLRKSALVEIFANKFHHSLILTDADLSDTGVIKCMCEGVQTIGLLTVKEPDAKFTKRLRHISSQEKGEAEFACVISNPSANVKWMKDDSAIDAQNTKKYKITADSRNRKLVVKNCNRKDEGVYSCVADTDSTQANLYIEARVIKFLGKLQDLSTIEGEEIMMQCMVNFPDVNGSWLINDEVISASDNVEIIADGPRHTIIFKHADPKMSGTLEFSAGSKSTSCTLSVQPIPVTFTRKLTDLTSTEHQTVVFECEVSHPTANVKWFKHGRVQIKESDKYHMTSEGCKRSLEVRQVSYEDETKYMCAADESRTTADLKIETVSISIVKSLDDEYICIEGNTATFEVEISDPEFLAVKWLQNGIELQPSQRVIIDAEGAVRRLTISDISSVDTGDITFFVQTMRSVAAFTVKPIPAMFETKLAESLATEHRSAKMRLDCTVSHKNALVSWKKDNVEIFPSRKYTFVVNGCERALVINNVDKTIDAGIYTASTADDSCQCQLVVDDVDLKFIKALDEVTLAYEKESLELEVETSHVDLEGKWYCNDQLLENNVNVEIFAEGPVYRIKFLEVELSMKNNSIRLEIEGNSTQTRLDVTLPPPRFIKRIRDQIVEEKEQAIFACEVNRSDVEVSWYFGETEITSASSGYKLESEGRRRNLICASASISSEGRYSVQVQENGNVTDTSAADLAVESRDIRIVKAPTNMDATIDEKCSIKVELNYNDVKGCWIWNDNQVEENDFTQLSVDGKVHTLTWTKVPADFTSSNLVFKAGKRDATIAVKVADAPLDITSGLKSVTKATEFKATRLEVQISRENGKVKWYKGRKSIDMGDSRYDFEAKGLTRTLVIKKTNLDDESNYTCQASDDSKSTTKLQVSALNVYFEVELNNSTINSGDSITLTCKTNESDLSCRWLKDGVELEDVEGKYAMFSEGQDHSLSIINASTMTSNIECIVHTARTSCTLNVKPQAAEFEQGLEDLSTEHKTEEIELSAIANVPGAKAVWYFNDKQIRPSRRYKMVSSDKKHSLIVSDVKYEDAGKYSVILDGENKSEANLTVVDQTCKVIQGLENCKCTVGDEMTFEVELDKADVDGTWSLNGNKIENTRNYQVMRRQTLHIFKINETSLNMSGDLLFSAADATSACEFKVGEQLVSFRKRLTDSSAMETDSLVLVTELTRPCNEVTWRFKDAAISNSDKYQMEISGRRCMLTIKNLSYEDEGVFTCECPDDSTTCKVSIDSRDIRIVKGLSDDEFTVGESIKFVVELNYDNVQGQWFINDQLIEKSDDISLTVSGRKHYFEGSAASNFDGTWRFQTSNAKSECFVKILGKPVEVVKSLNDTTATEKSSKTLEVQLSGAANVKWYKDRRTPIQESSKYSIAVKEDNIYTLTIHDVSFEDENTYILDTGISKTSCKLSVSDRNIEILEGLGDKVIAKEDAACEIKIKLSESDVSVAWFRNGQKLIKSRYTNFSHDGQYYGIVMSGLNIDDSGEISYEAETAFESAEFEVQPAIVSIVEDLENASAKEGEKAVFKVKLDKSQMRGTWFLNDNKLERTDRIEIKEKDGLHTLILKNCMKAEAGKVKFICNNVEKEVDYKVLDSPVKFTTPMLSEVVATENGVCELECDINRATAEVQWFKNGEPIDVNNENIEQVSEGRKRKLVFVNVGLEDAGEYTCKGLSEDAASTKCLVTIAGRNIKIRRGLQATDFVESETAIFDIELSHDQCTGRWSLNGKDLNEGPNTRYSIRGRKHTLTLTNLQKSQAGELVFRVSKAESKAKIRVLDGPAEFISPMQDVVCDEMETAEFSCQVNRDNANVNWYKGKAKLREIPGRIEFVSDGCYRKLLLHNVTFDDEKVYSCTAEDSSVSSKLSVRARIISIEEDLDDVDSVEYQTAVFKVKLSHENVPELSWYKDGNKLVKGKFVDFTTEGQYVYCHLKNLATDMDGSIISCKIDDYTSEAQLNVSELNVEFTEELKSRLCMLGNSCDLVCHLNYDNVPGVWYFNDKRIKKSSNIHMSVAGSLQKLSIAKMNEDLVGSYKFVAKGKESECQLGVKFEEVTIEKHLEPENKIVELQDITLCAHTDKPTKFITWYKDGKVIVSDGQYTIVNEGTAQYLTIKDPLVADTGRYTVDTGDDQSSTQLHVQPLELQFTSSLQDQEVKEFDTCNFECTLNSNSKKIQVRWFSGQEELFNSEKVRLMAKEFVHALKIDDCVESTSIQAVASAKGVESSCRTTANMTVIVPEKPKGFRKVLKDQLIFVGSQMTLEVISEAADANVIWMFNGEPVENAEQIQDKNIHQLVYRTSEKVHSGTYTAKIDDVETSCEIDVQEHVAISQAIDRVKITEGEDAAFSLTVNKPNFSVQWFKDGELIEDSAL